jgi:threonine/homoserine/homoserine lactone efflux protein
VEATLKNEAGVARSAMAESRRKAESRKAPDKDKDAEDARIKRLDRLALLLYLEGGIAIVTGMIVLSQFLSEGKPDTTILIIAGVLFGLLAVGITFTILARRRLQKK